MSLLLDALKKAAEQKAEKSKQEATPKSSSDETVIEATPTDPSALDSDGEESRRLQRRKLEDETEVDHSELGTRYEQTSVERDGADETNIDAPEQTDTRLPPSEEPAGGEDETIVFGDDDVSEFMGDPRYVSREPLHPEDETDLSRVAPPEDETGVGRRAARAGDDETDLSQLAKGQDETGVRQSDVTDDDETDISRPSAIADQIQAGQAGSRPTDDDTDLSQAGAAGDPSLLRGPPADETDLSQAGAAGDPSLLRGPPADETDLSKVKVAGDPGLLREPPADETDAERADAGAAGTPPPPVDDDDPSVSVEDMSLLLTDPDDTNVTSRTSPTDPRAAGGLPQTGDADLELVDTTRHRAPSEQGSATEATTRSGDETSETATTGARLDTLTTEGTTTRAESTATRTYAPDNYDRTLMKLPTDDASRLFAGMKSDNDVVMTPDYAKKVFRSKSSAQRLQHLKIYVGIFAVLLIAVLIYGGFEYTSHSESIDTSLRPLKRDPMPGLIQPRQPQDTQLFTGTGEVSQQALEIVESVDETADPAVAEQGVIAGGDDAAAPAEETADETPSAAESEAAASVAEATEPGDAAAAPAADTAPPPAGESAARDDAVTGPAAATAAAAGDSGVIASLDTSTEAPPQPESSGSSLQISSSTRPDDRLPKLREAYAAYQAGNDARALELYNEVLEIEPGNRNALLGRAAIYVQNGNAAGAVEDYQTLLLANPKDSLAMSSLISVINISPQESETRLKLLLRDEPESPYLNFALANAYSAQNRWGEAQGHYFTALQNKPEDPNYAYNLAVSLEHIAQPRAALTYYRRALENIGNGLATFNKDVVEQRLEVLGK